jgi:hypothetical protein
LFINDLVLLPLTASCWIGEIHNLRIPMSYIFIMSLFVVIFNTIEEPS